MKVNNLPSFTIRAPKLGATIFSILLVTLLLAQTRFVINNLISLAFFALISLEFLP